MIIIGIIITYYSIPKNISYYIYTHVRMHISIIWYIYIYIDDHIQYIYIHIGYYIYIYICYTLQYCVCVYLYILCANTCPFVSQTQKVGSSHGKPAWQWTFIYCLSLQHDSGNYHAEEALYSRMIIMVDLHWSLPCLLAKNIWVLGLSFVLRVVDDRCLKNHTMML